MTKNLKLINQLRAALRGAFLEREGVIDALLAAVIAGEHVVMLGPPGTGKSAIARALCGSIKDASYFEWLLNRYTEPNELFGGVDLPKWSAGGVYERRTAGMMPEAHIVFLDEVFKANSSILNALLGIVNERVFHDGGKAVKVPLRAVIAASNELPEGPELEALYDRFLIRVNVEYVNASSSFATLVSGGEPTIPQLLTLAELDAAVADAKTVTLGADVVDALFALRHTLAAEGIKASDRRWKKLVALLRAHAWLQGDTEVDTIHFEILKHGLWRDPREMQVVSKTVTRVASPLLLEATETFDAIMEQVNALPSSGAIKDSGPSVSAEIKKARKKLTELKSGATRPIASRIADMDAALERDQRAIVARVTAEMGL